MTMIVETTTTPVLMSVRKAAQITGASKNKISEWTEYGR